MRTTQHEILENQGPSGSWQSLESQHGIYTTQADYHHYHSIQAWQRSLRCAGQALSVRTMPVIGRQRDQKAVASFDCTFSLIMLVSVMHYYESVLHPSSHAGAAWTKCDFLLCSHRPDSKIPHGHGFGRRTACLPISVTQLICGR